MSLYLQIKEVEVTFKLPYFNGLSFCVVDEYLDVWFREYRICENIFKKQKSFLNNIVDIMYSENFLGIVPFVTSHLMERFFVFFTVAFILFLATAGGL